MARLLLILLLFAELAGAAVFAVALRYGRFDQGLAFYLYLIGPLLAVSVAFGVALPLEWTKRLGNHGLLLLGCVLFALPFVWLVSTSFKYEEEIFVYPPKWIPSTPTTVAQSPYIATDAFAGIEPPPVITADRWTTLLPAIKETIWKQAAKIDPTPFDADLNPDQTRDAMTRGLWQRAAGGISDAVWSSDDAKLLAAISDRVDAEAVKSIRDQIVRSVELGPITIADDNGLERRAEGAWSCCGSLSPSPGTPGEGRGEGQHARQPSINHLLRYNLSESPKTTLAGEFDLSIDPDRLLSIRLPMRQDRSWNQWTLNVETEGKRYTLEDTVYLGQRRWQELTFRLKSKDNRDERDVGIWPLVLAKDQSNIVIDPGKIRLILSIERATPTAAVWRKYTANYVQAYLSSGQRWTYVFNSLYLVVLCMIGQVLSCSMVAYAFARMRWPGRDWLFLVLLATMMLPGQVTMIPTFLIFKTLGWYNTLAALWAPSFLGSAFFIFMLRQFMKSIPTELEEAARIDGCGYFGTYFRIILPVMKPALAAVAIFTFMNTWNDFLGPLIYINDQRLYPLSLGLFDFRTQHGAQYGMLMAASTLMTLPVIAIFFLAQRYFIQGITLTGMKA